MLQIIFINILLFNLKSMNGGARDSFDWGAPIKGNARKWDDCPAINETAIAGQQRKHFVNKSVNILNFGFICLNFLGLESLRCNRATCALKCQPGFLAVGRRRTKCRFNKKTKQWLEKLTLL